MSKMGRLGRALRRFRQDRRGAALVEFAVSLPLIVLTSYISIDALRLMWSFQAATSGVHEAARYLSRVAPGDICTTGQSVAAYQERLRQIVGLSLSGESVLVAQTELVSIVPRLDCRTGTGLRQTVVPVATVSAEVRMFLPLHTVFSQFGSANAATFVARIEEQARVYGS